MKKIALVIGTLLGFYGLQGQITYKLGAYALPQLSQLSNSDDDNLGAAQYEGKWLQGMAVGIRGGIDRGPVSLNLDLIYSLQGGKFTSLNSEGEQIETVTRLQYVKIPLMIGVHTQEENNKIVGAASIGVQANILAKADIYDNNTAYEPALSPNITSYPSAYESFVPVDLVFVGEAGINIRLLPDMAMNIRLRGEYSFDDVENKEAIFLLTEAGNTREVNYWQNLRGAQRTAATKNIALGILMGLTLAFDP